MHLKKSVNIYLDETFDSVYVSSNGSGDTVHHIIIGFLINVQVQGHHPHQWAPFQVTG